MKHKQVEKRLLLYLDGDLSTREKAAVQKHLAHCSSCKKDLEELFKIWKAETDRKCEYPSPFIWTRLEARITEYERNQNLITDFFEQLSRLVRPAVTLSLFAGGILLGIYFGSVPVSKSTQSVNSQSVAQERERFFNSIYLDSFRDLPPESVGGVYVTLASQKNGGRP